MYVIATAGHVDHGKSTLVRALTGMEPDRLAEEKRRGLTIDLGFAWTTLPSGREVSFVDVPGHERFLANMLAGLGPAPVVCFVVAADQGWQAQSSDHRDAVVALGIEHGLVAITRADLASPEQLAATEAQVRAQLGGTPLEHAPIVAVSAIGGTRAEGRSDYRDAGQRDPSAHQDRPSDHSQHPGDPRQHPGGHSQHPGAPRHPGERRDLQGATPTPPSDQGSHPSRDLGIGTHPGLDELIARLDDVLATTPAPDPEARVRLWVDRSFSIRGAGTVITGSLTAGTLHRDDRLELVGEGGRRPVRVRGLQTRNKPAVSITPHARAAVNLRETAADAVHRGDALVTPGAWSIVDAVDVRRMTGEGFTEAPHQLVMHVGTAAAPARVRPFGDDHARLTLAHPLPLQVGDRLVLRSPGGHAVVAGVLVLDVDPPALRRRGDGARWATELAARPITGSPLAEVARRGAIRPDTLRRFGLAGLESPPDDVDEVRQNGLWWVHRPALEEWARLLQQAVARKLRDEPLAPGLSEGAAIEALRHAASPPRHAAPPSRQVIPPLPDAGLLPLVVRAAGLESERGALRPPGRATDLGAAEAAVVRLEQRLREHPFAAPEADELTDLRLGPRELAAAERAGRLLRLSGGVILLPQAPALAMRRLAALVQPFTASEARQALDTTRRVAIPLLEFLDARGWTRRVDATSRVVVR